jgi:hypothetical protein
MADVEDFHPYALIGPNAFMSEAADILMHEGVLLLDMPQTPPNWLIPGLEHAIERVGAVRTFVVDVSHGLGRRSAAHSLASRVMPAATSIRSASSLVNEPDLSDAAFIVHGILPSDWQQWSIFLRAFRIERRRGGRADLPLVAACLPPAADTNDARSLAGSGYVQWRGRISRADTEAAAHELFNRPDGNDLAHITALATAVELAGWDFRIIQALATLSDRLE